ncbi:carboxymethylenebutenolidase homolog [Olea europaea var. sylvestris]|uniref:carboxymethylenebutenolidase homolog n=1 Tax=Olea europaea var. sylvestris TaxID=158386 RepID=UPI000C1D784E|nr:carboxymethylenebutenolidase homolog [Olea europaea var. sylvestris]
MGWSSAPPVFSAWPVYKQHYRGRPPVSSVPQLHLSRCKFDPGRHWISFPKGKTNKFEVSCSQVEVEESLSDEACELVNGTELIIGEGDESISAHLFQAVKNNNATGILLLSDIYGFEESSTKDFAYRVACNGYNVLVPDLFHGDPWTKDKPMSYIEQWLAKQNRQRVAKDVFASAKWMMNEFAAVGISKKLGIIGFCFGGGRVVDILSHDQDTCFGVGVSFYGTRIESSAASNIKVPLLLIAGDSDPLCPIDVLEDIEKRNKESKMVVFRGRDHGFAHRPQTPEEDEDAEEAFKIMRDWLHDGLLVQN